MRAQSNHTDGRLKETDILKNADTLKSNDTFKGSEAFKGIDMFRGMEYVYAVWKEKSFSAAAEKLFITQPALSNNVKRVEKKIGSPIFDRSTSPIKLTEVGEKYIETVEQIMTLENSFNRFLADTNGLVTGNVVVGSGAMLCSYILPELVASYKYLYPGVSVTVQETDRGELEKKLMEGELDLVMENGELSEEFFERQYFRSEYMLLVVPKKWEINEELMAWQQSRENVISGKYMNKRYPVVPLELFRDSPFLMIEGADESHTRAMSLCRKAGFEPDIILRLNQQLTAYNMTCNGLGASFVSDTLIKGALPNPNVVFYKLNEEDARRDINLYYRKNRYLPRCVREFLAEADAYSD